ncbi:MAG: hypothetical protein GY866_28740 [Proteobacteria bacterium]|nr:hypothetical protein [Pseudomonadota bacterium]
MKSITIHGLSDEVDRLIRERAHQQETSLNKIIKQLLEKSLGLNTGNRIDHKKDFEDLFGIWTERDAEEFKATTKEFDEIDLQDWK